MSDDEELMEFAVGVFALGVIIIGLGLLGVLFYLIEYAQPWVTLSFVFAVGSLLCVVAYVMYRSAAAD